MLRGSDKAESFVAESRIGSQNLFEMPESRCRCQRG